MARKKKAALMARTQDRRGNARRADDDNNGGRKRLFESSDDAADDTEDKEVAGTISVNEAYARRFVHSREQAELRELRERYGSDMSESEMSEDEDEVGDLVTPEMDAAIFRTIAGIRARDPAVYESSTQFFPSVDLPPHRTSATKPTYLKDYHRRRLLSGHENADDGESASDGENDRLADSPAHPPRSPTYVQEQEALKADFVRASDSESELELEVKRKPSRSGTRPDIVYPIDDEDENEKFLRDFMINQRWRTENDKTADAPEELSDSDFSHCAEEFETAYNFRFEQPGGTEIMTHTRNVPNLARQPRKSSRMLQRERRRQEEEERKLHEEEDLKRLRNLKRRELESKLNKVKDIAGIRNLAHEFIDKTLAEDFELEQWDKRMGEIFNDQYYAERENKKDLNSSDCVAIDQDEPQPKISKKARSAQKEKLDCLVKEAIVPDKMPSTGFPYRQVSPDMYGLTPQEILFNTDAQLNSYVGLKKLAPYRPPERKPLKKKSARKKRLKAWRVQTAREAAAEGRTLF